MTPVIRWEDPPKVDRGAKSSKWQDATRPLIDHPKRWAVIAEFDMPRQAHNARQNLRKGTLRLADGTTSADYEFVARNVDGKGVLYARYVGKALA